MGWNFRKSISLGHGFRLNFSKSGIGISGGVKGLRISNGPRGKRLTASIPGTGIYYTKNIGKKRGTQKRTDTSAPNYRYSCVVQNDFLGTSRELRAQSRWELDALVVEETERQCLDEMRQRRLQAQRNTEMIVAEMNAQVEDERKALMGIINDTLIVNDRLDWDKEMIREVYPPFRYDEKPPEEREKYKLSFFKSLFMSEKKFEIKDDTIDSEIEQYERNRAAALSDYFIKKEEFESNKNRTNGELLYLKNGFEKGEKNAIERYLSIVLSKSVYPPDFERDFEIRYDPEKKMVVVDYLFQGIEEFPITERYVYDKGAGEIKAVLMERQNMMAFYTDVLHSVGIRTIHEVFESVYTDSVEAVCFNGYKEGTEKQCMFSMVAHKIAFEKLNLRKPVSEIMNGLGYRGIEDFTGSDAVECFA